MGGAQHHNGAIHLTSMRLSSRQAAVLMETHESSIKRWCNAGELHCETTAGGHRRIRLDALADFATRMEQSLDFLVLGEERAIAVPGLFELRRGRVTAELKELVTAWLLDAQSFRITALVRLARTLGVTLSTLYDRLIGDVMRGVGNSWASGAFQIGEEHRISESMLDVLYGLQSSIENGVEDDAPFAVLGAMREEDHVTGAMMVRTLLSEAGWKVAYLGRNVPEEDFVLFQRKVNARIVCISATVSRPPESIISVLQRVLELGLPETGFKVAVGGSGAKAARRLAHRLSHPDRVVFFDSATDFAAWATSSHSSHVLFEDETN